MKKVLTTLAVVYAACVFITGQENYLNWSEGWRIMFVFLVVVGVCLWWWIDYSIELFNEQNNNK